nr:hypothetical protein [Ectobacillus panaciterrae]
MILADEVSPYLVLTVRSKGAKARGKTDGKNPIGSTNILGEKSSKNEVSPYLIYSEKGGVL